MYRTFGSARIKALSHTHSTVLVSDLLIFQAKILPEERRVLCSNRLPFRQPKPLLWVQVPTFLGQWNDDVQPVLTGAVCGQGATLIHSSKHGEDPPQTSFFLWGRKTSAAHVTLLYSPGICIERSSKAGWLRWRSGNAKQLLVEEKCLCQRVPILATPVHEHLAQGFLLRSSPDPIARSFRVGGM